MRVEMASATAPTKYRFSVEEYHRMGEAGIFTEDDRVELWDGEIIVMSPIGNPHAVCVTEQDRLFVQQLADRAIVRNQQPASLLSDTEPEPDIVLARPRADRYRSGHPTAEDILLIIEVADTSLAYDRDTKIPGYGREGIPEAWLWDLGGEHVYVYQDPCPEGYRSMRVFGRGDVLTPSAFPDVRIPVDEVL